MENWHATKDVLELLRSCTLLERLEIRTSHMPNLTEDDIEEFVTQMRHLVLGGEDAYSVTPFIAPSLNILQRTKRHCRHIETVDLFLSPILPPRILHDLFAQLETLRELHLRVYADTAWWKVVGTAECPWVHLEYLKVCAPTCEVTWHFDRNMPFRNYSRTMAIRNLHRLAGTEIEDALEPISDVSTRFPY